MGAYARRRLVRAVPVIIGVMTLVFLMIHMLPGDPAEEIASRGPGMSPEAIQAIRVRLGLDKPLHVQYWDFVSRTVRGDLGRSILSNRAVSTMIREQLPATAQLTIAGIIMAILIGVPLGIIAAVRQSSWVDSVSMTVALLGVAMPGFWLGLLLIFLFAVRLHWLPVIGGSGLRGLILPAFTLGFGAAAIIARLVRSSMLEVLRQEYMTTARAKGLRQRSVILRHGLKNALIPVMTIVGLQFGNLLGGAVVIETVFARQGIGRLAINAILAKDFPVIQGTVLFAALVYVSVNLTVDLLYSVVDPRIRYD
ncbi:MAG TPA: nickel ABC transporter permease [Thermomicrobiales bacterium]|nr:nickel ABC transporter permease [Thermomicrobiales bacterium]